MPQAMGSGPLAQPLFYQYKCTPRAGRGAARQWIYAQQRHALTGRQVINGRPMFSLK